MIRIKFFSLIREALDTEELTAELPDDVRTVAELKDWLSAQHGELWRSTLAQPNLVHAVNHCVVDPDHGVKDADEVAFFPPMTGG